MFDFAIICPIKLKRYLYDLAKGTCMCVYYTCIGDLVDGIYLNVTAAIEREHAVIASYYAHITKG